jgi:hypothetical protein
MGEKMPQTRTAVANPRTPFSNAQSRDRAEHAVEHIVEHIVEHFYS